MAWPWLVIGTAFTLEVAAVFAVVAAVLIFELQDRGILNGDTAIAIIMTGTLALGLVLLRLYGGGITPMVEGFLYGNLLFIDDQSLDFIVTIGLVALFAGRDVANGLLAAAVDPVASSGSRHTRDGHWTRIFCAHGACGGEHGENSRRLVGDGALGLACGDGATNRQEFPLVCAVVAVVWSAFGEPRHLLFG